MVDLGVDLKMIGTMDPYILLGYVTAFAAVIGCYVYGRLKKEKGEN
jgi:hypothetical protein